MTDSIDIVLTWVDNKDPAWIKEYEKYSKEKLYDVRFEELGTLKYIFRGIENFLPWIRTVHFVTFGHLPSWMNLEHPKLQIVNHHDIFPDTSVLPTFNSSAIEMNFHFIQGLSETFIYFNDDTFVLKQLPKEYFFTNGLPNDFYIVRSLFHDDMFSHLLHSDMQIINDKMSKEHSLMKQFSRVLTLKYGWKALVRSSLLLVIGRQIPLFELYHHPQPHLKSNFIEVNNEYPEIIQKVRGLRFRSCNDVNQYVFRFWGLIKGKYYPKKNNDAYYVGVNDINDLTIELNKLKTIKPALVCFNEEPDFSTETYHRYKQLLHKYLDKQLSEKSLWEK